MSVTIQKLVLSKDYKRDLKKIAPEILSGNAFSEVFYHLYRQQPLPADYRDHSLSGLWCGYRDCHICNDLVLIYKIDDNTLFLARLAPHADVFKKKK